MALRWPALALAAWLVAWLAQQGLTRLGAPAPLALGGGLAVCIAAGWWARTGWQRLLLVLGYALLMLAAGRTAGWVWLVPLALLLVAYPLRTWGDAPLYPTPLEALRGLAEAAPLPPRAAVLEAGCGLGHGLVALHRQYPEARLVGLEWSAPLAWLARARCRFAQVERGDIWAADWSAYRMVYLFQRPESMPRAWAKAQAEMAPGSWLVSLAFEVPGTWPTVQLASVTERPVFVYRIGPCSPTATPLDGPSRQHA